MLPGESTVLLHVGVYTTTPTVGPVIENAIRGLEVPCFNFRGDD